MRCRSQRSPVVLEVGIGHGNTLTELKHKIPHIIPIGMDIYISDESKQKAKTSNLLLIEGNAEEIPIRDDSVDILYSVQTYRYTCDKLKFLSEAYRVISPEGLALIEIGPDWSEYSTPGIQEIITSAGLSSAFEIDKILLFGRKKTTSDTRVLKIRPAGKKKELNWRVKFLGSRTSRYYTESSYEIK